MTPTHILVAASTAFVLCSCSHKEERNAGSLPVTHSLMVEDFTLSDKRKTVQLGQYTVRLVSIASDGATQIKVIQTDKVLTARPGQYFESYEFGKIGLQLKSATNGVATFFSQGCVTR
jgi:hypothetical protein